MSQVSVTIDGRKYRLACNEGEEARLESLAGTIDEKIGEMRKTFGEIGDQRLVIMAALTLADSLTEARDEAAAQRKRSDDAEERASALAQNSTISVRGSNCWPRVWRARKSDFAKSRLTYRAHRVKAACAWRTMWVYTREWTPLATAPRFGPPRERQPRFTTRSSSRRASRSRNSVSCEKSSAPERFP